MKIIDGELADEIRQIVRTTMRNARDGMLTGPVQPEVEVKWNILQNKEWCPFCDRNVCIDYGPWPFVRGTVRPVCVECAAERGVREPFKCGRDEKPTEE